MRVRTRALAAALALSVTTAANLGVGVPNSRVMAAEEMAARTGGAEGDKFCGITAGVTAGCLITGQMYCALGGALTWMVFCETGG
jgi:hypothetical protein